MNLAYAESAEEAKPSFDCAKATTKVEKMICEDSSGELQNLDRYMTEVYTQLKKELKNSKFPNREQKLRNLLESQRVFLKENLQYDSSSNLLKESYEIRITHLLKLLGEVLDSNNKELCQYARGSRDDMRGWRELPPSINPPFSIGLCAFGRNNRDVSLHTFCAKGEAKKEELAKAVHEESPYIIFPRSYEKKIDINNDGKLEHLIYTQGGYFSVLWIYKDGKIDEQASDRIYGDDLHFSGTKTEETICVNSEEACMALITYALPANKISQRLEFNLMPILSHLFYSSMEFKGKNYIALWSKRFYEDEDKDSMYPTIRIYILEGNKRELKCTY